MKRYICDCGNTCLESTKPDNTVCGGCNNPNWNTMSIQEPYRVKDAIEQARYDAEMNSLKRFTRTDNNDYK